MNARGADTIIEHDNIENVPNTALIITAALIINTIRHAGYTTRTLDT